MAQADLVLGIDVGTSAVKVALFDAHGAMHGSARADYPTRSSAIARKIAGGALSIGGYGVWRALGWLKLANGAPNLEGRDCLSKILWLRDKLGGNAARYLDVKDWLVHRCTGRYA